MNEYAEVSIGLSPFQPWADILLFDLPALGYDSFNTENERLLAYIPSSNYNEESLIQLLNSYGSEITFDITLNLIQAQNWNEVWESSYDPIIIGGKVYVYAPFHPEKPEMDYSILLAPKMAFGTGHHATTEMMMEGMLATSIRGARVLDVGCGTAILSILAELMGSERILAIDNDQGAVINARENISVNNCRQIMVEKATIQEVGQETFNVILANINRNVILQDMPQYKARLSAGGSILLSGFQEADLEVVKLTAGENELAMIDHRSKSGWCFTKLESAKIQS